MNLHRPSWATLSGLSLAALLALAVACAGCGGSSPSTSSPGAQGSGTVATQPASAPATTKPAAPAGSASKCSDLSLSDVAVALGGPITQTTHDSPDSVSFSAGNYTLQCTLSDQPWPTAITGDFTQPLPNSPCASGEIFATGAASPFVGAFCHGKRYIGIILDSNTRPDGSFYPINAAQQKAVGKLMGSLLSG